MDSVENSCACTVCHISDLLFGFAILMVCIDSAKWQSLTGRFYWCCEEFRMEQSIIRTVVMNAYIMGFRETFKACLSSVVEAAFNSVIECVYVKSLEWSMNTVAPIYRFVVGLPLCMGTNPGVVLIIWSMLTTSHGQLAFRICVRAPLCRQGLRCTLPYAQPGQIGGWTSAKSRGIIPHFASSHRTEKLRWPSFSWMVSRRICLRLVSITVGSSDKLLSKCIGSNSVAKGSRQILAWLVWSSLVLSCQNSLVLSWVCESSGHIFFPNGSAFGSFSWFFVAWAFSAWHPGDVCLTVAEKCVVTIIGS